MPSQKPVAVKKRVHRLPATYSKEYPIGRGHAYLLKGIPADIWARAIDRADSEDLAIRTILILSLKHYVTHGLPPVPTRRK